MKERRDVPGARMLGEVKGEDDIGASLLLVVK